MIFLTGRHCAFVCHARLDRTSMPSLAMDTRVRGYDKFSSCLTQSLVTPDLIGGPCFRQPWIPACAGMTNSRHA